MASASVMFDIGIGNERESWVERRDSRFAR